MDTSLRGQVLVMLTMPSPRHWLCHANGLANQPGEVPEADTVEDASIFLAELLRAVSNRPVGGVLPEEAAGDAGFNVGDVERYRSVLNVARHYRWSLALRIPPDVPVPDSGLGDFDAVIAVGRTCGGARSRGRDISAEFAHCTPMPLDAGEFYFATLDPGLRPESVLETLTALRQT